MGTAIKAGSDSVYAAGLNDEQGVVLTSYSLSGSQLWSINFGGGASSSEFTYPMALAIDPSQNVYVTGYTSVALAGETLHGNADFFIQKYSSSGSLIWTVEDGSSGGYSSGQGIRIDASDDVWVTGLNSGPNPLDGKTQHGNTDMFITEYDSSGGRLWTYQDGAAGGNTQGLSIVLNAAGTAAFVTGYTTVAIDGAAAPNQGYSNYMVAEWNSAGRPATTSMGTGVGTGIAVDGSDNVYVYGTPNGFGVGETYFENNTNLPAIMIGLAMSSNTIFLTKYDYSTASPSVDWSITDTGTDSAGIWNTQIAYDPTTGSVDLTGAYFTGDTASTCDGQSPALTWGGLNMVLYLSQYGSSGGRNWTVFADP